MELIQGSETSANYNLTPGKYPKENIQLSFYFNISCKWDPMILTSYSLLYEPAFLSFENIGLMMAYSGRNK